MFGTSFLTCLRGRIAGFVFVSAAFFFIPLEAHAGFLYLLNDIETGSRIYGFRVNEVTGALTALPGFPVNAGNGGINSIVSERMAVDGANGRLYVINDSSETVSAYSIDPSTGALTEMPFSPIALGAGVWNTIAVHPSGSPIVISNNATNGLAHSFRISSTAATPATGSPFLVGGAAGFSSTFNRYGFTFYVGGNIGSTIAGFSVNQSTGVLTALGTSPFDSGATGPLAYAMDLQNRLFTVDSADAVRVFTSSGGALSPVTGNPFPSGLTQRRYGLMHHTDRFYIVAGNTGNNVGVYQISGTDAGTTVAPVAGSPFPTGATTANCLALNKAGNFLYVGNRISRNVTPFSMNTSTGQLVSLGNLPSNTLGATGAINGCGYYAPPTARADFDGDSLTDLSVFRSSEGNWYLHQSANGPAVLNWGVSGDIPAPGDYDGDEKTDVAVFRPLTGQWWILRSSDGSVQTTNFGVSEDVPVAGDWDGDAKTDIAVYRPSTSVWYILNSGGGTTIAAFGAIGDVPVWSDYDGDGRMDLAIFRLSNSQWWIRNSLTQSITVTTFGLPTDELVPADYDGDSRSDIAVFRPSNGSWHMIRSSTGSVIQQPFGASGDVPVPGDYDGDGRDDLAVYRNGVWWLQRSTAGVLAVNFGISTDIPIPAKYLP
ncbi:MAG TPA: FG-GAP-like repeat-containing protein [Pyrinomonadaceae bacterium]